MRSKHMQKVSRILRLNTAATSTMESVARKRVPSRLESLPGELRNGIYRFV